MPGWRPVAACAAALIFTAGSGSAQPKPALMGSSALSWEDIMAKNPGGKRWQIFQAPTVTLEELEMHVTEVPGGQASHAPHRHYDEEIIIIRQGTFEVFSDGKLTKVGPGGVIFHASQTLHGLKNIGDGPGNYHVIRWKSKGSPPH
jgi:XRE family transcriptional regulator, regulator of sulfur utilization